jgi:hypothetical protein
VKPETVIADPGTLASVFAHRFAAAARTAIETRGQFSCALPGGSVAEGFLPVLARAPVRWDKIEFFWGDERAVGPNDPDSNFGLAKRLLLESSDSEVGCRVSESCASLRMRGHTVSRLGPPRSLGSWQVSLMPRRRKLLVM